MSGFTMKIFTYPGLPQTDGTRIRLYELGQNSEPMSFAPHAWKSALDLRRLGLEYERVVMSLQYFREQFKTVIGMPDIERPTVPTLAVYEGTLCRKNVMGSRNIADYLDATFGETLGPVYTTTPTPDRVGQCYADFVEHWVDLRFAECLRPCVLHTSYATFKDDDPSKACFLAKCGQAKMDELTALNADKKWCKAQYESARLELEVIERMLAQNECVFLTGDKPVHADFCLFAFYPYSLTNPELVKNTWRHPSLPHVNAWLDGMLSSGLVSPSELLPERLEEAELLS